MGAALHVLERNGRVTLEGRTPLPVGSTGARALAAIEGTLGERTMLAVFDRAREKRPRGALSDAHIRAAQRDLMPPPVAAAREHIAARELGDGDEPNGALVDEDITSEDRLAELRQLIVDLDELSAARLASDLTAEVRRDMLDQIAHGHRRLDALAERIASPKQHNADGGTK
jgi:hypothetical protein